jgi:microcystin-dependent protein
MSAPFVAEIRIFACNFAPTGWARCNGQLLPISQNTALFSLVGTFYGGDGKSTFALPNLQGSVALNQGQSTTGADYFLGQQSGSQFITLLQTEMPLHTHSVNSVAGQFGGNTNVAAGNAFAKSSQGSSYTPAANLVNMAFQTISLVGGGLPHNNMQPFLTLTFCIAMQGVFPPRP